MNLSTLFFVFAFLPVSLILYLVCPRVCKNALLVLISFVFYAWGSPVYPVSYTHLTLPTIA
mgnify:CR=1 FL=1